MTTMAVVYGSPTPPGKLARALDIAEQIAAGGGWNTVRVAPGVVRNGLEVEWPDDAVSAVGDADAVILATPVFRATMSGALKTLIDRLPVEALRSVPVGILTVAATEQHALGAERHLRDVLAWFGAVCAPNPIFLPDRLLAVEPVDSAIRDELAEFVGQLTTLCRALDGATFGPPPLAARHVPS